MTAERERTPGDEDSDIEELEGMDFDDEELGATEPRDGTDEPPEDTPRRSGVSDRAPG